MTEVILVGISFPKNILTRIDYERGDVPRSRYLLRVLENALQSEGKEEWKRDSDDKKTTDNQDSLDSRFGACNQANPGTHKD